MRKLRTDAIVFSIVALVAFAISASTGGCADMQKAAKEIEPYYHATTQTVAELETELEKMPEDDPGRADVAAALEKFRGYQADIEKALAVAKADIESELWDELATAVPYGGIALVLARLVSRRRITEQVVHSVEKALPYRTAEQKAVMNKIQDAATRREVKRILGQ